MSTVSQNEDTSASPSGLHFLHSKISAILRYANRGLCFWGLIAARRQIDFFGCVHANEEATGILGAQFSRKRLRAGSSKAHVSRTFYKVNKRPLVLVRTPKWVDSRTPPTKNFLQVITPDSYKSIDCCRCIRQKKVKITVSNRASCFLNLSFQPFVGSRREEGDGLNLLPDDTTVLYTKSCSSSTAISLKMGISHQQYRLSACASKALSASFLQVHVVHVMLMVSTCAARPQWGPSATTRRKLREMQ